MTPAMLVPSVPKTRTTASAINAAATAYSESSRPLSSLMNARITILVLLLNVEVRALLSFARRALRLVLR